MGLSPLPTNYNIVRKLSQFMNKQFNQAEYTNNYHKENYKQFKVDMKEHEKRELVHLIKENGYSSNREFLLSCTEILKEKNNIFRKKKEGIKMKKYKVYSEYEKYNKKGEGFRYTEMDSDIRNCKNFDNYEEANNYAKELQNKFESFWDSSTCYLNDCVVLSVYEITSNDDLEDFERDFLNSEDDTYYPDDLSEVFVKKEDINAETYYIKKDN